MSYYEKGLHISRKWLYRLQQLDMINKDKAMTQYKPEDSVYLISLQTSLVTTSSKKFKVIYFGPLVVYKLMHKFQYILMDTEIKILNSISHFHRLKQAYFRTTKGPVNTLVELNK